MQHQYQFTVPSDPHIHITDRLSRLALALTSQHNYRLENNVLQTEPYWTSEQPTERVEYHMFFIFIYWKKKMENKIRRLLVKLVCFVFFFRTHSHYIRGIVFYFATCDFSLTLPTIYIYHPHRLKSWKMQCTTIPRIWEEYAHKVSENIFNFHCIAFK